MKINKKILVLYFFILLSCTLISSTAGWKYGLYRGAEEGLTCNAGHVLMTIPALNALHQKKYEDAMKILEVNLQAARLLISPKDNWPYPLSDSTTYWINDSAKKILSYCEEYKSKSTILCSN